MSMKLNIWRKIKPTTLYNGITMMYGQVITHLLVGELFVLPWYVNNGEVSYLKLSMLYPVFTLIYINIVGRFWKIWTINTTVSGVVLPTFLKPGWFYCAGCACNCPPRSYHCITCNKCVLKRDHHCTFSGKCIGYFTFQHYLYLVLYACIGCWINISMGFQFTWSVIGGFSKWNLFYFILPIPSFFTRQISFNTTVILFACQTAIIFGVSLTLLIVYHAKHVIYNLTTYERRHNIYDYDLGLKNNLLEVFGSKWYIAWLLPIIDSPLPGDGIEFITKDKYEDPKDV